MKLYSTLLALAVLVGCAEQKTTPSTSFSEEKTKEVLDHHWVAFRANDLEETMKDYTEESVLITPDATYNGLAEIRENFVKAFDAFPKDSATLTLTKSIVVKDVGYIIWSAVTPTFELSYATDTFIQDGKIVRQTYAGVTK